MPNSFSSGMGFGCGAVVLVIGVLLLPFVILIAVDTYDEVKRLRQEEQRSTSSQ